MKAVSLTLTLLALAAAAGAQEYGSDHGRIRFADPGVTLQRASDTGAEEASPNAPLLPGDRVWTDGAGRAQFQFRDGSVLSLDSRSKLDYIADDEAAQDDGVSLRLWSGSLILHVRDGRRSPRFQIETPGGLVTVDDRGVYRIDAEPSETRLSVYEGQAVLDAARRRVVVEEGQTILVRRGEWPEPARSLGRDRLDDFAAWDREQADLYDGYAQGRSARYLPEEVAPYASDFENNGTWHYETEVGYVWAPRVEAGWRPYSNGRWCWTSYGWTWVPNERWGFAPSHYGRWGVSAGLGWYWIPGAVWSPAWVSWAVGGDYVGWCPLGHRDRPVAGFAVARGSSSSARSPEWSFARRGDMASRDLGRRRVDPRRRGSEHPARGRVASRSAHPRPARPGDGTCGDAWRRRPRAARCAGHRARNACRFPRHGSRAAGPAARRRGRPRRARPTSRARRDGAQRSRARLRDPGPLGLARRGRGPTGAGRCTQRRHSESRASRHGRAPVGLRPEPGRGPAPRDPRARAWLGPR